MCLVTEEPSACLLHIRKPGVSILISGGNRDPSGIQLADPVLSEVRVKAGLALKRKSAVRLRLGLSLASVLRKSVFS
jgi:hypothetical protein